MPHIFFQRLENRQSTQTLLPFAQHTTGLENSSDVQPSQNRILPFIFAYYGIDFPEHPYMSSLRSLFSRFFPWID